MDDGQKVVWVGNPYRNDYEPSKQELEEFAVYLGMDLKRDRSLLWIAREAIRAPLPDNWQAVQTESDMFYHNVETGESTWDSPTDEFYRQLYVQEKRKLANGRPKSKERLLTSLDKRKSGGRSGSSKGNSSTSSSSSSSSSSSKGGSSVRASGGGGGGGGSRTTTSSSSLTVNSKAKGKPPTFVSPRTTRAAKGKRAQRDTSGSVRQQQPQQRQQGTGPRPRKPGSRRGSSVSEASSTESLRSGPSEDGSLDAEEISEELYSDEEDMWKGASGGGEWYTDASGKVVHTANTRSKGLVFKQREEQEKKRAEEEGGRRQAMGSSKGKAKGNPKIDTSNGPVLGGPTRPRDGSGAKGRGSRRKQQAEASLKRLTQGMLEQREAEEEETDEGEESEEENGHEHGRRRKGNGSPVLSVAGTEISGLTDLWSEAGTGEQVDEEESAAKAPPSAIEMLATPVWDEEAESTEEFLARAGESGIAGTVWSPKRKRAAARGRLGRVRARDRTFAEQKEIEEAERKTAMAERRRRAQKEATLAHQVQNKASTEALLAVAELCEVGALVGGGDSGNRGWSSSSSKENEESLGDILQEGSGGMQVSLGDLSSAFEGLRELVVDSGASVGDSDLRVIADACRQLESVRLSAADLEEGGDGFGGVGGLDSQAQPSDAGLAYLFEKQPWLTHVELDSLQRVEGECFSSLSEHCHEVSHIGLRNMRGLRWFGKQGYVMTTMRDLVNLDSLEMVGCQDADMAIPEASSSDLWVGYALMRRAPNLRRLTLSECPGSARDVRKSLNRLTDLREVVSNQMDDETLLALFVIATRLCVLDTGSQQQLRESTLEVMMRMCSAMEGLAWRSKVCLEMVERLLTCYGPRLRTLEVCLDHEASSTDAAGRRLSLGSSVELGRLERCVLHNALWLTDEDVMTVCTRARKLRELVLEGCFRVTGECVVDMGAVCKQLRVFRIDLGQGMGGIWGGAFGSFLNGMVVRQRGKVDDVTGAEKGDAEADNAYDGVIQRMAKLQELHVSYSLALDTETLERLLKATPALERLVLTGCPLLDGQVPSVVSYECAGLRELCLKACAGVNGVSGHSMVALQALELVVVSGCKSLRANDVAELLSKAPGVKSVYAKGCAELDEVERVCRARGVRVQRHEWNG